MLNGNETAVDCGGDCEVCADACSNGVQDLGEEDIDCGENCVECLTCTTSSDCSEGQICSNLGNCISEETTIDDDTGGIDDDTEIIIDDDSGDTVDFGDDDMPTDTADEIPEKSHLLSILFLAIGIAIMGGAGYFLYEQNEQKKSDVMQQQAYAAQQRLQQQPQAVLTPQERAAMAKAAADKAQREKALREAAAAREEQKQAERRARFASFGGIEEPSVERKTTKTSTTAVQEPTAPPTKGALPSDIEALRLTASKKDTTKNVGEEPEDDFVSLENIGKKKPQGKEKKDDAFDALENLKK